MESIIIFIILSLLASFFGKKNEPEKKTSKPINRPQQQGPVNQNPFKNLGELAKEFQQQQQSQMEQRELQRDKPAPIPKQVPSKPSVKVQEIPDRTISRTIDHSKPAEGKGRLSIHQDNTRLKTKEKPALKNVLPNTEDELLRGIIFSEILGPPKSKR